MITVIIIVRLAKKNLEVVGNVSRRTPNQQMKTYFSKSKMPYFEKKVYTFFYIPHENETRRAETSVKLFGYLPIPQTR